MNDCEEKRNIDRIRAISFKEAKDSGADFITREWVMERIGRSRTFVTDNWNRDPYHTKMDTHLIGKSGYVLNEHEKRIIRLSSGHQMNSVRKLTKRIVTARGDAVDRHPCKSTVHNYMKSIKLKPFHVIRKPLKTERHREDRLWFCEYLRDWGEEDFLHLVCSDEFYVYLHRKPNSKNDIVWATEIDEIPEHERFRQTVKHPQCIGIFVCFSSKKMMWVVKEQGESWTGQYFRETIIEQHLLPFLRNPDNILDIDQPTLVHDKAPCFKALQTQQLLLHNNIDFFGNNEWPGNSPDLNPCENFGSIIKDHVDQRLHNERELTVDTLRRVLDDTLRQFQNDTILFERLLRSYPDRLNAVVAARGGHTKY